jgi:hypothetical protein
MSKGYVSEFSGFMNKYIEDHPEVVKAQQIGGDFFWDRKFEAVTPNAKQNKDSSTNRST